MMRYGNSLLLKNSTRDIYMKLGIGEGHLLNSGAQCTTYAACYARKVSMRGISLRADNITRLYTIL